MIISPLNLLHEVLLALPDDLEILAISVLDPLYPLHIKRVSLGFSSLHEFCSLTTFTLMFIFSL